MYKLFTTLLTVFTLSCFAQDKVINDKNAQSRAIGNFNAIKVSGAIDVYLSQGGYEALAVSASEEKFRDRIKAEVKNGTLTIWYDGDKFTWSSGNKKLKAYVSFKSIDILSASGASEFLISGTLSVPSLQVKLTGASEIKGAVKITDLIADLSGASNLKINGTVVNIKINADGASDIKGYDLVTDECTASLSGASDINITINKVLSAHATGASSIHYKGAAVVKDLQTSGASSVSKKS